MVLFSASVYRFGMVWMARHKHAGPKAVNVIGARPPNGRVKCQASIAVTVIDRVRHIHIVETTEKESELANLANITL